MLSCQTTKRSLPLCRTFRRRTHIKTPHQSVYCFPGSKETSHFPTTRTTQKRHPSCCRPQSKQVSVSSYFRSARTTRGWIQSAMFSGASQIVQTAPGTSIPEGFCSPQNGCDSNQVGEIVMSELFRVAVGGGGEWVAVLMMKSRRRWGRDRREVVIGTCGEASHERVRV